jgi:hypothetical protein
MVGPIMFLVMIAVFIFFYVFIGSTLVNEGVTQIIANNDLNGSEYFALKFMNLWIFIGLILVIISYGYMQGG